MAHPFTRVGVCAGAAAVVLAAGVIPNLASADSRDDAVAKQEAAETREDEARSELEGVNAELADAVLKLQQLKTDLDAANADLDAANARLAASERTQTATQDRLAVAEANLAQTTQDVESSTDAVDGEHAALAVLVRERYRGDSEGSTLAFLSSGRSTGDLSEDAATAGVGAQIRDRQLQAARAALAKAAAAKSRQESLTEQIAQLKAEADRQVGEAEDAQAAKAAAVAEVERLTGEAEDAKAHIEEHKSSLENDIAEAEAAQQAAADEIARIDAENRAKEAAAKAAAEAQRAQSAPAGGTGPSGSLFTSPLHHSLYVTSPYGWRTHPVLGYRLLHEGVDLQSPCGEQQFAALGGTVVSTRNEGPGGNTVTINHGIVNGHSWVTKYRHMTRFAVSPGQQVSQGQLIGYSGATGRVTGCHVHFEIWKDGSTIDPMSML